MNPLRVLFLCIHNSARSQMAEAFLKKHGGAAFQAESAGLEPGALNPLAVTTMKEIGIDISMNQTRGVLKVLQSRKVFDYVITVCDETSAERCPAFPGKVNRLHWNFADPSSFTGSEVSKLEKIRAVRNEIEKKIIEWVMSKPEKKEHA